MLNRRLAWQAVGGLVVVVAVAGIAGVVLRGPITGLAGLFIGTLGWPGVFLGVLLTDASPIPMTHEPVLLLGVAEDLDVIRLGLVASTASVTAGPIGYAGGRMLRAAGAEQWLSRRAPQMVGFLQRWGALGVALAALLPIPFAVATWTAGAIRVPFLKVAAASLLRVPKTCFYLWLIYRGWNLGS
jgi:membrane protein YqaA with SNARE-associated domain